MLQRRYREFKKRLKDFSGVPNDLVRFQGVPEAIQGALSVTEGKSGENWALQGRSKGSYGSLEEQVSGEF